MQTIKSKYIFIFSVLVLIAIVFFYSNIPFFWDGEYFSKAATFFYNGENSFFDCGAYTDNTTLPLYSWYLSFVWSVFSKTLFVSHAAIIPFLILLVFQFYKMASRFLTDKYVSFSLVLLLIEPTFLTQTILMGYDIVLTSLFLFAINLLLNKKRVAYSFLLPVLALFSIRALFLTLSLFIIDLILEHNRTKKINLFVLSKAYFPCFFLVCSWFVYHKFKTGWFLFSPLHEKTDEHFISFQMVVRQILYAIWKIIDFGRFYLIAFILLFLVTKKEQIKESKNLFLFLFVPTVITMLFMMLVSNPVGHKYFIFNFVLLIICFCFVVQRIKNKNYRIMSLIFAFVFLVTGNFWIYPQKYGNGWDSSLKILPYFKTKNEMDLFVKTKNIEPKKIATQFPLHTNNYFSYLSDSTFVYTSAETEEINNYNYFLFSNIMNPKNMEEIEKIKKEWLLLKEVKSGFVSISLYQKK